MNQLLFERYLKDFRETLRENGIGKGDVLYVASDVSGVLIDARRDLGITSAEDRGLLCDGLVTALQETVGPDGQLLFPVFSWAFCKGEPFDRRGSRGQVGILGNHILLQRSDFARTAHPMYSFMTWGRDTETLCRMQNQESWGRQSPFAYLHSVGAKQLNLNVSTQRSFTFQHYVEQSLEVPYRYPKYFMGRYVDLDGSAEVRTYSMYVRDLDIQMKEYLPEAFVLNSGCARHVNWRSIYFTILDLKKAYDVLARDLRENGGRELYSFTDYRLQWDQPRHPYEVRYLDGTVKEAGIC